MSGSKKVTGSLIVDNGYMKRRVIEQMPDYDTKLAAIYKMTQSGAIDSAESFVEAIKLAGRLSADLEQPEEVSNVEITVINVTEV